MVRRLFPLALVVILAPVPAFADLRTSIAEQAALAAQSDQADSQRQLDAAIAQKASGKKKMFIGIGGMAGGVLIGTLASSSCINSSVFDGCRGEANAALLGGLVSAGGGGVFLWGLIEWMDANSALTRLNGQRPANAATLGIHVGEHQVVRVGAGVRSSVALALSW